MQRLDEKNIQLTFFKIWRQESKWLWNKERISHFLGGTLQVFDYNVICKYLEFWNN